MKSLVWFSAEEVQASHITQPMLVSMVKGFLKTPEPELVSQATSLLAISVFLQLVQHQAPGKLHNAVLHSVLPVFYENSWFCSRLELQIFHHPLLGV